MAKKKSASRRTSRTSKDVEEEAPADTTEQQEVKDADEEDLDALWNGRLVVAVAMVWSTAWLELGLERHAVECSSGPAKGSHSLPMACRGASHSNAAASTCLRVIGIQR